MVDLRPDQLATIRSILGAHVPECEVWAFGSRAKWTAKDTSDLDLALVSKERLSLSRLGRLREAFKNSYLTVKVDVIDIHRVSDEFRNLIEQQKVVIQRASGAPLLSNHSQWKTLPLEESLETIIDYRGKTPKKVSSGIPLITAKVVKNGRIETPDEFIAEEDYEGWMRRGIPRAGDVLLTMEAPLGEVAQLDDRKVALAQRLVALRGKPNLLDNDFLKFLLQSALVQDQLKSRASGTTVLGIKQSELRKINLALPPLQEQKSIARVLGALDDKIESNRRMNETLEALAQSIFKSWFIDPAANKPPKGWEPRALYDCANYINGAAFRNEHFSPDRQGLPVIKIGELKDGITAQTKYSELEREQKYRIVPGDILFSWSGSPDTSIDTFVWTGGDGWLNQHIFKIEFKRPIEKYFVYYLLLHLNPEFIEIARNKQTTGLGHVTAGDLKRLQAAFPTDETLGKFNRIVEPLFQKAYYNMQESRTLAELRDTLLPKLVSGELRVPDVLQ